VKPSAERLRMKRRYLQKSLSRSYGIARRLRR